MKCDHEIFCSKICNILRGLKKILYLEFKYVKVIPLLGLDQGSY